MPASTLRAGTPTGRAGLLLAVAGTAAVLWGATGAEDPALVLLLAVTLAIGALFVAFDFGFTGGFRALVAGGDGRALAASCIVPAAAALVIIPVAASIEGFGRFVAPIGPSLVVGAAMFGVGMQLAGGCGSGVLVALGQGSRRSWIALPFFCLGGVAGSLVLPWAITLPGLEPIDLVDRFGPWGGLLATEALLLATALLLLRGARPPRDRLVAGLILGTVAAAIFLASGHPWGITMGFTLWGAKAVEAIGFDLGWSPFWADPGMARLLVEPALLQHASTGNLGVILGALAAAAMLGRLRHGTPIGRQAAAAAALGGLLMGIGARLAFGCNVGAFIGGVSSGSLHGFVWLAAAIPGSWAGVRLRRRFGLDEVPARSLGRDAGNRTASGHE